MKAESKSTPLGNTMDRENLPSQPRSVSLEAADTTDLPESEENTTFTSVETSIDTVPNQNTLTSSENKALHPGVVCKICQKYISCKDTLVRHILFRHKLTKRDQDGNIIIPNLEDPNFICQPCNQVYDTKSNYLKHLQIKHAFVIESKLQTLICPTCLKLFGSNQEYFAHMSEVENRVLCYPGQKKSEAFCDVCCTVFSHQSNLLYHIEKYHKQHPRRRKSQFYCQSCDHYFYTYYSLCKHRTILHKVSPENIHRLMHVQVEDMPKSEYNMSSADSTTTSKSLSEVEPDSEEGCKSALNPEHMTVNINKGDTIDLYCRPCEKYFDSLVAYRSHLQDIHKASLGPKVSNSRLVFTRSQVSSSEPRKAKAFDELGCPMCDNQVASEESCNNLVKGAQETSSNDKDMKIIKNYSLQRFNLSKPISEKRQQENGLFVCSDCGSLYLKESSLDRHLLKAHEGTPKYACSHCNRKYRRMGFLRKHMEVCHVEENGSIPHAKTINESSATYCSLCKRNYSSFDSYNHHRRFLHNKKHVATKNQYFRISKTRINNLRTRSTSFSSSFNSTENSSKTRGIRLHNRSLKIQTLKTASQRGGQHRIASTVKKPSEETFKSDQEETRESNTKTEPKPREQPNFNDPNNYCLLCKLSYSSRAIYLIHLSQTHDIEKDPNESPEHDAASTVDILGVLDPASCNTALPNPSTFTSITEKVHQKEEMASQSAPSLAEEEYYYVPGYSDPVNQSGVQAHETVYDIMSIPVQEKQPAPTTLYTSPLQLHPTCPCLKTFKSQENYIIHMTGFHKNMLLEHHSQTETIGISDAQLDNMKYASGTATSTSQSYVDATKSIPQQPRYDSQTIIRQTCVTSNLPNSSCGSSYNPYIPIQPMISVNQGQLYQVPTFTSKRQKMDEPTVPREPEMISCEVCNISTSSKYHLSRHLKMGHSVIQKVLVLSCRPNSEIQPDANELDTVYCKSCDYRFESANVYRKHLIDIHQLNVKPISEDDPTVYGWYELDDLSNVYCKVCEHMFSVHPSFLRHMAAFHDVDLENRETNIQQKL
ncbi:uncharacterized protein EV154DRAFT_600205 [Mucor mucedo]|uniref:uncharacterized protein n=1 Tax=Mucor mucedo TaxID=29922 RepID=UPI00221FF31B|nr:uncharacterized protein EV154DRAFT_600205 [Mucor mucedo]KAI7894335.1 hypothetical protein EV154DRAFT_600205 [Mucor mucedo]